MKAESDMKDFSRSVAEAASDRKAVRSTLVEMKVDICWFDERLKHMPTNGFIFAVAAAIVGATSAIVALVVRLMP